MLVQCKGDYGIERAGEFREQLLAPLNGTDEAVVDFSGVNHADYTFFQIIHSAIKTYKNSGRTLVLQPNLPPQLASEASRMGLAMLAGRENSVA